MVEWDSGGRGSLFALGRGPGEKKRQGAGRDLKWGKVVKICNIHMGHSGVPQHSLLRVAKKVAILAVFSDFRTLMSSIQHRVK